MATRLSKKERGFIKDYIKTGNGTKAALNNYDTKSENTAAVIASENLTKPKIIKAIDELLPDELLSERHLELLNKREVVREIRNGKLVLIDSPEVQAVSKGLDMAYKIKGSYAPEKHLTATISLTELLAKAKQERENPKQNTEDKKDGSSISPSI